MSDHPASRIPYLERLRWFHQARYGLFIHYGPYSVAGRGEWLMFNERMPPAEYAKYAEALDPAPDAADRWVRFAKESGMKYAVLTARHHDGFSLFDSPANSFNLMQTRGRDLVAEFIAACRAHGITPGIYYSLLDWRFPGYFDPVGHPDSAEKLLRQVHEEVRHLMTAYGEIAVLWYDGGWIDHGRAGIDDTAGFWRSGELNQMVYDLQPGILINNRSGIPLDLDTPEQHMTASERGRAWESCMTVGDSAGWGWLRHNPNRKTTATLVQNLIECAAGEGNFLINIGPRPDGSIDPDDARPLAEVAQWLREQGEGIHGSEFCELYDQRNPGAPVGFWTRKGATAYLHVLRWPGCEVTIPLVPSRACSATLLADGREVSINTASNGRRVLGNLPVEPPHPCANTIRIEFDEPPRRDGEADHAAWLR